jgi:hypothetical protein
MIYKVMTADGTVTPANVPGIMYGVVLTAGANNGNALFKDGGASGTNVIKLNCLANTSEEFTFTKPIRFTTDIYLDLTNLDYVYILFDQNKATQ